MVRPLRPAAYWGCPAKKSAAAFAIGILANVSSLGVAQCEPAPLELYRLDCGSIEIRNLSTFSDTYLYEGQSRTLTVSCYLIRDGDRLLLWDTGLDGELESSTHEDGAYVNRLEQRIVPQLERLGLSPDTITFVGLSHYHFDHIGQAADFASATLLIGKNDWAVAQAWPPARERLAPWTTGESPVEAVEGDRDVFGDGRVTILALPGHTEGHQGLLVRLDSGPVLLTGDLYHFGAQLDDQGIPGFNTSRSDTLDSRDRFDQIARRLGATIIVQHDPDDVSKLPPFPTPAR